jgi:hypothetical protein
VPRSAFLEGAREAGGTKTCSGAIAKQKTAVPQGAASLSLAVLESDGRKREGSSDEQCGLVGSRKAQGKTRDGDNVRAIPRLTVGKATGAYARQSALGLLPLGGDSRNRGERRASWRSYETAASLGPKKTAGRKKLAYRRGETVSLGKRDAVLRRYRSARSRRRTNCGQPIGCPPRGFPLSESRLRRRRCGPRFDWEFPFRFLASAVCSHGRTPHLQGQASRSK